MEKETSTSKKGIQEKFNEIANFVKEKYGANIWFVEIMGKRHSYVAGHREDSFLPPEVVYLNERYAVVSNEWDKINDRDVIVNLCNAVIEEVKL